MGFAESVSHTCTGVGRVVCGNCRAPIMRFSFAAAVLLLPAIVGAQQLYSCPHGKSVSTSAPSWISNQGLKDVNDGRIPKTPARHTVDLDLPASERWLEIGQVGWN